jgi:prepilin-type N-terminal cleavage/methylation domain-containing protein
MKRGRNKGFTLIELLLVILIITGLAAIVVPNYMKVSDESDQAVNAANDEALRAAVRLMVLDVGLSNMPGGAGTTDDLNAPATNPNLTATGGSYVHGPYIDPADFPVEDADGAQYQVLVSKNTGSISITP